jgi:hypothetical protein
LQRLKLSQDFFFVWLFVQGLWNVTPEPEMLTALPQEYTLFSALADELVSEDLLFDRIVKHSRAFVQWLLSSWILNIL